MNQEEIINVFRELGLDEKIEQPYPGAENYAAIIMKRFSSKHLADGSQATDSTKHSDTKE